MSADQSATHGFNTEELLKLTQKGAKATSLIGDRSRIELLANLNLALQAYNDGVWFNVEVPQPLALSELADVEGGGERLFKQFSARFQQRWEFVEHIESEMLLYPMRDWRTIKKYLNAHLSELINCQVRNFVPPGWRYLEPNDACQHYREIFGPSLRVNEFLVNAAIKRDRHHASEGSALWPKLTTLCRLFGIEGNPLDPADPEGPSAYIQVVQRIHSMLRRVYNQEGFGFKLSLPKLTPRTLALTAIARRAWKRLENASDDDFVYCVAGANSGSYLAGRSGYYSRVLIAISPTTYMPQDAVMVGCTLLTQPDRILDGRHLGIGCPGNQGEIKDRPGGDESYHERNLSLHYHWDEGYLVFGNGQLNIGLPHVGSAVILVNPF